MIQQSLHRHSFLPILLALVMLMPGCATPIAESPKRTSTPLHSKLDLDSGQTTRATARSQFLLLLSEPSLYDLMQAREKTPGDNRRYRLFLSDLSQRFGVRPVAEWSLASVALWCIVVESENRFVPEDLLAKLSSHEAIDSAQPMRLFQLLAQPSNDPHRSLQTGLAQIRAEAAHRFATGTGSRVAVIDTGIDSNHIDLTRQIQLTENLVDDDDGEFQMDIHGTVVASVIAASRDNGQGMIGVAPDAQLLALKACWSTRPGFAGGVCSSYTLAKALDYSLMQGVDVINLSLNGPSDPLLQRLLAQAVADGVVVVGAAASDQNSPFPANVDGVIAVSEQPSTHDMIVVAPGKEVLGARPDDNYDFFDGRSLAVAHVSGIAALVKQRRPHITSRELSQEIARTSAATVLDSCQIIANLIHADC